MTQATPPLLTASTCQDAQLDLVTEDQQFGISVEFEQYNASTKKATSITWNAVEKYWAWGFCVNYNDCDGAYVDLDITGSKTGFGGVAWTNVVGGVPPTVEQGQNSVQFYWTFDDWKNSTDSGCDECDPDPGGQTYTGLNEPTPSLYYYFNYACVVTPN